MKKFKKSLAILLALIMCLGALPLSASAANIASGGFGEYGSGSWVIDADGKLTISGEVGLDGGKETVPWYNYISSVKSVTFASGTHVKTGASLAYMFNGCSSLTAFDASNFNTSSATNMGSMFNDCTSLKSLDLSSFDTSLVTYMNSMFCDCISLKSLDLSSFNTSSVTNMGWMFADCSTLTSLDLSSFNTSSVTNMFAMFFHCSSLKSLDLSSFNTSSVTSMGYMFSDCSSLTNLDLSSFNIASVTDFKYIFRNCGEMVNGSKATGLANNSAVAVFNNHASIDNAQITFYLAEIESVTITDVATPAKNADVVCGCTIPNNAKYSKASYNGSDFWWVETDTLPATYEQLLDGNWYSFGHVQAGVIRTFAPGKYYTACISIKANDVLFSSAVTATVNGNEARVATQGNNKMIWYCFGKTDTDTIDSIQCWVDAPGIDEWIMPGAFNIPIECNYKKAFSSNYGAWVETDAPVTSYQDLEAGTWIHTSTVSKFNADKHYSYVLSLKPYDGYVFSSELTATVNRQTAGINKYTDYVDVWCYLGKPGTVISTISVTDIVMPVTDEVASFEWSVPSGNGYSKDSVEPNAVWIETDNYPSDNDLRYGRHYYSSDSDLIFKPGKFYTFCVNVVADPGYAFPINDNLMHKFMNNWGASSDLEDGHLKLYTCFLNPANAIVDSVAIEFTTPPIKDENATYDWCVLDANGYFRNDDGACEYGFWRETDTEPTSYEDTVSGIEYMQYEGDFQFKPDKYYTFFAYVDTYTGYEFAEDLSATVNGKPAHFIKDWRDWSSLVWYCFGKPTVPTVPIDFVDIMDVTPPVAGETPSFNYRLPSDSGYVMDTPTYSAWIETDIIPTTLSDYDDGTYHFVDDGDFEFNPDKYYSFRADIIAEEGYSFSNSLVAEINGNTAYIESLDSTHQTIMFCFGKPAAAISSVEITGVTAPFIDNTPSFDWSIPSNSGYEKAGEMNCAWVETDAPPESFFDIENGTAHWNTDGSFSFDSNKYYTFRADVMAEAGYNFSSSLSATMNTQTANVKGQLGYKTIWYYFGKPAATVYIDSVDITNVTPPVAGATPNFDFAIPSGAGYTVSSNYFDWLETDSEPTTLPDYDDGTYYSDVDGGFTFDPDKYYSFRVTVKAKEGYAFSNPITAEMNGNAAYVEWLGNTQQCIMYCFGKPKTLSSISVTTQPTKKTYTAGENFDKSGMVVKANYSDSTSATITSYTVTNGNNLTAGQTSVTISYTEGGVTKTASVAITVNAPTKTLSSISVTTQPTKKTYTAGENFDKSGMVVKANYSDSTSATITSYTVTDGNNLTAGKTSVTISYTEGGVTKTASVAITVNDAPETPTLESIRIDKAPTKTSYKVGETVSTAGLKVMAVYSDESETDVTASVAVLGFNTETIGSKKATVSYSGKTATFNYVVTENIILPTPTVKINNNPGTRTINYGEGILFNATATDLPEGAKIVWFVNDKKAGEGASFKFTDAKADTTITVKIVDKDGNVMKDATDGEISASEKITVKAGFFQKLISFFKNLFKINRIIAQAVVSDK